MNTTKEKNNDDLGIPKRLWNCISCNGTHLIYDAQIHIVRVVKYGPLMGVGGSTYDTNSYTSDGIEIHTGEDINNDVHKVSATICSDCGRIDWFADVSKLKK